MIDETNLDALVKHAMQELHDNTLGHLRNPSISDFEMAMTAQASKLKKRSFYRIFSKRFLFLIGIAAVLTIGCISLISILSDGESAKKSTSRQSEKSDSKSGSNSEAEPKVREDTEPIQSDDSPNQTTVPLPVSTTISSTTPNQTIEPFFKVIGYDKTSSQANWRIDFQWSASTIPNVSYCIGRTSDSIQNCFYDPARQGLTGSSQVNSGDAAANTFYLFSVTISGAKKQEASTTYAVPD